MLLPAFRLLLLSFFVLLLSGKTHCAGEAPVVSISVPFVSPNSIPNGEINTKTYVTRQDRYHRYRIPGAVVSQDGTILAFAEGRRGLGNDPRTEENAPIDMVMRRSTDNGQTWEPLVVIDPGFRPNGEKVDFGDPTPFSTRKQKPCFCSTVNLRTSVRIPHPPDKVHGRPTATTWSGSAPAQTTAKRGPSANRSSTLTNLMKPVTVFIGALPTRGRATGSSYSGRTTTRPSMVDW